MIEKAILEKRGIDITITPTVRKEIAIGNVIILRNVTFLKELDFAKKTNFIATVCYELKRQYPL
jgi:hypothetical protein